MFHGMPYKRLPKELIKGLVRVAIIHLNMFPSDDGVSDFLSPLTIITDRGKVDYNKLKLEPGTYYQVTEEPSTSYGMKT